MWQAQNCGGKMTKPNKTAKEEFEEIMMEIFPDELYKDKKGKWRWASEGYNFDFEKEMSKLFNWHISQLKKLKKEGCE